MLIDLHSRFDEDMSIWKATHEGKPDFLATSQSTKDSLLLGPQTWTIHSKSCSILQTYTLTLKLTGCGDDEFTCSDGTCVPIFARCDAKNDCSDNSDETNCKT
jgi:hypothetical protein